MTPISEWQNFYVVVGSAAGALTGLQFVTMALIADLPLWPGEANTNEAFTTPSLFHFGSVLILSALLVAPWHSITPAAVLCGIGGLSGVVYAALILRRVRTQTAYRPVAEDWIFHTLLPLVAYGDLCGSAFAASTHAREALFGIAASTLLLLCIGIHNAWDNVNYIVFVKKRETKT